MNVNVYLADQNPQRDRTQGITTYTRGVLSGLATRPDMALCTVVSRSSYVFTGPRISQITLPWRSDKQLLRLWTDHTHRIFVRAKADVWYYPKGYLPFLVGTGQPVVGTIHDTIVQYYADHHPEYRPRFDYAYWLSAMKRSMRRFDHIVTVSQSAKRQIEDFGTRYRIALPPITVAYEAVELPGRSSGDHPKQDYVCHFASGAPHKNTEKVVRFWLDWVAHTKDIPQWLYLLGREAELFKQYESSGRVRCLGQVSRDKLFEILSAARALIMASAIEGFGLPVLEAYLSGTPACVVRGTACEEVVASFTQKGGFDLHDNESFEHALDEVLRMSADEVEHIKRGIRACYSIERVSGAVADSLKSVAH